GIERIVDVRGEFGRIGVGPGGERRVRRRVRRGGRIRGGGFIDCVCVTPHFASPLVCRRSGDRGAALRFVLSDERITASVRRLFAVLCPKRIQNRQVVEDVAV